MRLEGTIAFVTGAGGGIGRSICDRFLAEGARVVALDINADAAAAAVAAGADDGRGFSLVRDVGDSAQVRDALAETIARFGGITTLVNIAGGSTDADGPATEAPEEEFWRAIRLDLFGTFAVCKYGIPELIRQGGGSVINFSSMMAMIGMPGRDCYTSAKGGVTALTRSLAVEFGSQGVRVNAIAPGLTLTPRVVARMENSPMPGIEARHLLGACEPIDMAHMAVYLASGESRHVTGQILRVDSGSTIN